MKTGTLSQKISPKRTILIALLVSCGLACSIQASVENYNGVTVEKEKAAVGPVKIPEISRLLDTETTSVNPDNKVSVTRRSNIMSSPTGTIRNLLKTETRTRDSEGVAVSKSHNIIDMPGETMNEVINGETRTMDSEGVSVTRRHTLISKTSLKNLMRLAMSVERPELLNEETTGMMTEARTQVNNLTGSRTYVNSKGITVTKRNDTVDTITSPLRGLFRSRRSEVDTSSGVAVTEERTYLSRIRENTTGLMKTRSATKDSSGISVQREKGIGNLKEVPGKLYYTNAKTTDPETKITTTRRKSILSNITDPISSIFGGGTKTTNSNGITISQKRSLNPFKQKPINKTLENPPKFALGKSTIQE